MFQRRVSSSLDVGEFSVKFASVESDSGRIRVLWKGEVMPERQSQNDALAGDAMKTRLAALGSELSRRHPNLKKQVAVPIQGEGVTSQYLELPPVSTKELELAVPSMARRFIPFPIDTVTLSYVPVPQLSSADKRSAVFFVAVQREAVNRLGTLVQAAGFELKRLEVGPLALVREFSRNHEMPRDRFTALVHVGYRHTICIVLRERYPYYVRDFTPAGRDFTYAFQMGNQSTWEAAEHVKRNYDVMERDVSMEPFMLRWLDEVRRSLEYFRTQVLKQDTAVSQVFLSGGGAAWKGLDERLAEHLEIPVIVDFWNRSKMSGVDWQPEEACQYKLAAGAALQD